jgi:hypothetical protein
MSQPGLLWLITGVVTALLFLKSQQWSVDRIDPLNESRSIKLIIGGAIFRWLFIFIIMGIALSQSYRALFIVFSSFMLVRLAFVFGWHGRKHSKPVDFPQT